MKFEKLEMIDGVMGYWHEGAWYKTPVTYYQEQTFENINGRLSRIEQTLGNNLTYHADINFKSQSEIIVVGTLNGHDYFKHFYVDHQRLPDLLKILGEVGCIAKRGFVDFPGDQPPNDQSTDELIIVGLHYARTLRDGWWVEELSREIQR